MHMESMCCVPSGGRGSCAHLHSLVWWMGGEDQIGDCFLQVPMCPFWSQCWFCSHPQGGKGEQGLPGPLGPKGEKGARVSAPAMATADPSQLCPGGGLGCEPPSHGLRGKPAAWPKWGMRARLFLGNCVWKLLFAKGTWDCGIPVPIFLKTRPYPSSLFPTPRAMTVSESPRMPHFR